MIIRLNAREVSQAVVNDLTAKGMIPPGKRWNTTYEVESTGWATSHVTLVIEEVEEAEDEQCKAHG